jgi:hypothetical protein
MSPLSDTRLPDWLQGVSLDPGDNELDLNRERVRAVVKGLSRGEALDIFAYAYRLPSAGDKGFSAVVTAVREHADESWAPDESSVLAHRLAASAIADLLAEGDSDSTILLAQAVLSAAFSAVDPPLPELPNLAQSAVVRVSTERRRRERAVLVPLEEELEPAIKALTIADGEGSVSIKALRGVLAEARAAFRTVRRRIEAIETHELDREALINEELDVLWWAQGGVSTLLEKPWREAGEAATLLVPLELASRTYVQPPPRSSSGLIDSALDAAELESSEEIELGAAVEAASTEMGSEGPEHLDRYGLFPLSAAMAECKRKSCDPAWRSGYLAEFGLDPADGYPRKVLAGQMLREMSLQAVLLKLNPA